MRFSQTMMLVGCAILLAACGGGGGGVVASSGPPAPPLPNETNPPLQAEPGGNSYAFAMPSDAALHAGGSKVFAHRMANFPLSIDNQPADQDYYTLQYLDPTGEGGIHRAYGGFIRERPGAVPVAAGSDAEIAVAHQRREVRRAVSCGLDGFICNILTIWKGGVASTPGEINSKGLWTKTLLLLDAAQAEDPGFRIIPMADHDGWLSTLDAADQRTDLVWLVQQYAGHATTMRLADGRIVVGAYLGLAPVAERTADATAKAAVWRGAIADLHDLGIEVALIPCCQDWQAYTTAFADVAWGFTDWGDRSPAGAAGFAGAAQTAHGLGKTWMAPIGLSDVRPRALRAVESRASAAHRAAWTAARADGTPSAQADLVQVITWNDYSESSECAPSTGIQNAFAQLVAYHSLWFKQGAPPAIVRDRLVYFHRTHRRAATPDPTAQPQLYSWQGIAVDEIELVAFLTAPATIQITSGGTTTSADVPAGLQILAAPLAEGRPAFRIRRSGTTVVSCQSLWEVSDHITYQDPIYRGADDVVSPPGAPAAAQ